jgi:UTP--glucose-1-phosphate uridylyltransferase
MFGDDIVLSQTPCIKQLIDVYDAHQPAAVVAFQEVPRSEISRYASAKLKPGTKPLELDFIIEKAPPEKAPSLLAQLGRFVLDPKIIDILEKRELGLGNELYLTDAIDKLCRTNRVIAHPIEGAWHTTGDPLRFLITSIESALRRQEFAGPLATYLRSLDLSKLTPQG